MKILVYGVHHWFNKANKKTTQHLREWEQRITTLIPGSEIFITTGCYSDPTLSPFNKNIPIIQNKIPYTKPYSQYHNYFRNGFMTGIWHALLNHDQWDAVFHIQPRVLLGVCMKQILQEFLSQDQYQVLTPNLYSEGGTSFEISFFGMKPGAAKLFSLGGYRNSFLPEDVIFNPYNVEEEAYLLFNQVRYNPWPDVFTTRQIDSIAQGFGLTEKFSPFTMLDKKQYGNLPLVSTSKHALQNYVKYWKSQHKI